MNMDTLFWFCVLIGAAAGKVIDALLYHLLANLSTAPGTGPKIIKRTYGDVGFALLWFVLAILVYLFFLQ